MAFSIDGSSDHDYLYGSWEADRIDGKEGNDVLLGYDGDDVLIGGAGEDRLNGDRGNDTYLFSKGDGVDTIEGWYDDRSGVDRILFDDSIAPADLRLRQLDDNLFIEIGGGADRIVVQRFFAQDNGPAEMRHAALDLIVFADGMTWDREAIVTRTARDSAALLELGDGDDRIHAWGNVDGGAGNDELFGGYDTTYLAGGSGDDILHGQGQPVRATALLGGAGNDRIEGGSGDDLIAGGTGNDVLDGGTGRNTYLFTHGWGQDRLEFAPQQDWNPTSHEIVLRDVLPGAVALTRSDNGAGPDLVITLRGIGDSITVTGYFASPVPLSVRFADGTVLQGWAIEEAIHAPLPPDVVGTPGDDRLYGGWGDDVLDGAGGRDELYGLDGNDVLLGGSDGQLLDGGFGDDLLVPRGGQTHVRLDGGGTDTILFGHDSGKVVIFGAAPDTSALVLVDEAIRPADLVFKRMGDFMAIYVDGSEAFMEVQLRPGPDGMASPVALRFADGTRWDSDRILEKLLSGDDNNNDLMGFEVRGDRIEGHGGNDFIDGRGGDDWLSGGEGDDHLIGGWGDDRLEGGAGFDVLEGGEGGDILAGGQGGDVLRVGPGADVILFNLGDGLDIVERSWLHIDIAPVVRLGPGIAAADVKLQLTNRGDGKALSIEIGSGGDRIDVPNFSDGYGQGYLIGAIEFADGTVWDLDTILKQPLTGTEGADVLTGGAGDDRIEGRGGDDTLVGGDGNDQLDGGAGNDFIIGDDGQDVLIGGSGNNRLEGRGGDDVYQFALGDGVSIVDEGWHAHEGQGNVLRFGEGIDAARLHFVTAGPELHIYYGQGGQIKLMENGAGFERIEFADGSVASLDQLARRAPVLQAPIEDAVAMAGAEFHKALAPNTFVELDAGDYLSYAVTRADGAPLPAWLGYDSTGSLHGMPSAADAGLLELRVTATDSTGRSTSDVFTLDVRAANVAPTVRWATPDFSVNEGYSFGLALPEFVDANPGDKLTIAVLGEDGVALPSWMSYDAATNSLLGVTGYDSAGTYTVKAIATDSGGLMAASTFKVTVNNVNRAPVAGEALGAKTLTDGVPFSYVVPAAAFSDPDAGDTGSYSASGLPAWLTFDAATRTFSGTPGAAGSQTVTLRYTDAGGLFATTALALNVGAAPALTLTGTAGADTLVGKATDDSLYGLGGNDTLDGGAGADRLDGGAGADKMLGGLGNDSYYVDNAGDETTEGVNAGLDQVFSSIGRTLADNLETLTLTGAGAINGTGNNANNLIAGNGAANTLAGNRGHDFLVGGAGNDTLSDLSAEANLFNGGAGADSLTGGAASELFIGGIGNDSLSLGTGRDILAFNKGDGQDVVLTSGGADNILSLGGVAYADLALRKSGNALVLHVGATDQITFNNWYASNGASVAKLQVVIEGGTDHAPGSASKIADQKVELFDFLGLVQQFNLASKGVNGARLAIDGWLAAKSIGGSDTAAIGGDLAYQYATDGDLADVGFNAAVTLIGSANFGVGTQTLLGAGLVDGSPLLG